MTGATASAQDFGGQQRPERKRMSTEEIATMQTERMAKSLELTEEQKQKIHKINLESAAERQRERELMRKMMQEQREKQKVREEALDSQMREILDEAQYKKWLKQKQTRQNRGQAGQNGNGGFGSERPVGGPGGFGNGFDGGMGF